MGFSVFPAVSSGLASVVKSIQRGTASSAGNITITAVDTSKTIVNSFSIGSAGTVAATGTLSGANGTASAHSGSASAVNGNMVIIRGAYNGQPGPVSSNEQSSSTSGHTQSLNAQNINLNSQNVSLNSTNLSGGSNNLVSAVYGAYLVDSTTIAVTGACRYEVIEYF